VVKEEKENIKTTSQESDKGNNKKKKKRKLPSCFGFISTWIAKRKEKRREKKRKILKPLHKNLTKEMTRRGSSQVVLVLFQLGLLKGRRKAVKRKGRL
jgi:hypothetical protein